MAQVDFATSEDGESCVLASAAAEEALGTACISLGIETDALYQALTVRTVRSGATVGGALEAFKRPLNALQASAARDALARYLYGRIFDWVVAVVNRELGAVVVGGGGGEAAGSESERLVRVVDFCGFEMLRVNSFEQVRARPPSPAAPPLASPCHPLRCHSHLALPEHSHLALPNYSHLAHPEHSHLALHEQLCINFADERLHQLFVEQVRRGGLRACGWAGWGPSRRACARRWARAGAQALAHASQPSPAPPTPPVRSRRCS